jgi:hypothetical protein
LKGARDVSLVRVAGDVGDEGEQRIILKLEF